jgi:hypothetical protein
MKPTDLAGSPALREVRAAGAAPAHGFERLLVAAALGAVLLLHARWILVHFSSDGYLIDSGWFAFLFGSADPWLRNPASVNDLSYYAHHFSPYLFAFGAPLARFFGLDGIRIFALHQGLSFALFLLALYLIASSARPAPPRLRAAGVTAAILIGGLADILFQAAAYPHFEIALLAVTSLALAACLRGNWPLFLGCLLLLPAIREDGGFYAALACLLGAAVTHGLPPRLDRRLWQLLGAAIVGVLVALLSVYLKGELFPGYATFAGNFSGEGWRHLTPALLLDRATALLANRNFAVLIAGTLVLAFFDRRYVAGLLLLSPLLVLHLAALRDELGRFTLYYALPWLLVCAGWLAVYARRTHGAAAPSVAEGTVLLVLALLLASPVQALLARPGNFWAVARAAATGPVAPIDDMREFARSSLAAVRADRGGGVRTCASLGIAALVPDDLGPREVVDPGSGVDGCDRLLLMRGDMHYVELRSAAEAAGLARAASVQNAELWAPP